MGCRRVVVMFMSLWSGCTTLWAGYSRLGLEQITRGNPCTAPALHTTFTLHHTPKASNQGWGKKGLRGGGGGLRAPFLDPPLQGSKVGRPDK